MAPSAAATIQAREWATLVLVLVVAALFRLIYLDNLDLDFDQASAINQAYEIAHGQWRSVAFHSGSVVSHPPIYLYTLAVPFLFSPDLVPAAAYQSLLGVAAVGLCWWLTRRHLGPRAAWIAALLFAVAPWSVAAARRIVIESLPLYTLVLFCGVLEIRRRASPWGWPVAGLGLTLCLGTHLANVILLPVIVVLLARSLRQAGWARLALAAAPLILLSGTYLAHEGGTVLAKLQGLTTAAPMGSANSGADLGQRLVFPFWLSGGWHVSDVTGPAYTTWLIHLPAWTDIIHLIQAGGLLVATVWLVGVWWRQRSSPPGNTVYATLLAWWLIPIVVWAGLPANVYWHYYLPLYPVQFMIMAWALDRLLTLERPVPWQRWAARLTAIATGGLLIFQSVVNLRLQQLLATEVTTPGGYAEPMRSGLAAASWARTVGSTRDSIILVANGADPSVEPAAAVLRALTLGHRAQFVDPDEAMILRGAPSLYLFAPDTQTGYAALAPFLSADTVSTTTRLRGGVPGYLALHTAGAFVGDQALPQDQWRLWESGAQLIGYQVTCGISTLEVTTMWSITAIPPEDIHWFHHLYQGDQRISQVDIGGVDVGSWRVGDVMLNWARLDLPAGNNGQRELRLGSYTYPALRRLSILDAAGNPVSDELRLPLTRSTTAP